jgi:nucleoside-diphosphate-sugar epimerase
MAVASGLAGMESGATATEADMGEVSGGPGGRVLNERLALELAGRGVRSMSVRFAPTVHGEGDHGFIAMIVAADRAAESASYIGDGLNRWPAVHVSDAARLVRLGVEGAPAGSVLHAVAEEGIAMREIAHAIGSGLDLPVTAITNAEADQHFGFLARFLGRDMLASSEFTQELLSWGPAGPTLVEDLEGGHYFAAVQAR